MAPVLRLSQSDVTPAASLQPFVTPSDLAAYINKQLVFIGGQGGSDYLWLPAKDQSAHDNNSWLYHLTFYKWSRNDVKTPGLAHVDSWSAKATSRDPNLNRLQ